MPRAFGKCPACGGKLIETSLYCEGCQTELKGQFTRNRLSVLTSEQEEFVLKFLSVRGSLKEMERLLGVSYPTVRVRLDEILNNLGIRPEASEDSEIDEKRKAILDDLETGRLSAQEAVELLRKIKAGDLL